MRILFICKDNPFGVGGANYAAHAYLRAFSDLSDGQIDVVMSSQIQEDESIRVANYYKTPPRSLISRLLSVVTGQMHRHTPTVKSLLKSGQRYDLIVFNNSKVSANLLDISGATGARRVTIHHNLELEYFLDNTPNAIYRNLFRRHVVETERSSYLYSEVNLFLTNSDLHEFKRRYGNNGRINECIRGFEYKELPDIEVKPYDDGHPTISITGSLCTVQGIDGVKYFFSDLYPSIPGNFRIIISGRSPSKEIIELCESKNNVELIANPKDMNEVINQADIYLCPTRLGGGQKLRVMDGLRLGLPVLCHVCSERGYEDFKMTGNLESFSDTVEFATALNKICERLRAGETNRYLVRKQYAELFSYEADLSRIKKIF
mgnify:CR=1 FL=1